MGLNPNAPAWTPGLRSSGERSGDSPDRNGRGTHYVSMHHKREEGKESDGVGWLNLPVNQDREPDIKRCKHYRSTLLLVQETTLQSIYYFFGVALQDYLSR